MARTHLHQVMQGLFTSRDLCYWACEFMSTYTNQTVEGAWYDYLKKTMPHCVQHA